MVRIVIMTFGVTGRAEELQKPLCNEILLPFAMVSTMTGSPDLVAAHLPRKQHNVRASTQTRRAPDINREEKGTELQGNQDEQRTRDLPTSYH